ncbi:MAG: adenosine deaminase [Legionellaceae bacterium]|nr:adenosine deaminase [Legionellaceae bacterium]
MFPKFIKALSLIILSFFILDASAGLDEHLNSIRNNPQELYSFFKQMPKGGELHYHFTGSAYPEDLIKIAVKRNYCLNPNTLKIMPLKNKCNGVFVNEFLNTKDNYEKVVQCWSMKNLKASYKDRHDHFFNVFEKINPLYDDYYATLLSNMILRAANQNELYMEIMLTNHTNPNKYARLISHTDDLAKKKEILMSDVNFQHSIQQEIKRSNSYLRASRDKLGCSINPDIPACKMVIKFQEAVLRETSNDEVFAQSLLSFAAASKENNILGVNLVQPENGTNAMGNFHKHMAIFNFLHKEYPKVHIALHAGELDPKTNKLSNLSCHINESIHTAYAERIGHGTDIKYETNNKKLLKHMKDNQIAVEINLSSNNLILSIRGPEHPITYYLENNVPIVLSTDDEGILRTNLTQQYVDAAKTYNLSYSTIKNINRNALTYSFLSGRSIWLDPEKDIIIPNCKNLDSKKCLSFIKKNEKARIQWELEKRLNKFERKYEKSKGFI